MRTRPVLVWLALVGAASISLASCGSSDSDGASSSTSRPPVTTTTVASSTSRATTTTPGTSTTLSTTTSLPQAAVRFAVWPYADSDTRYDDPVAAATGFATDFLGFVDPVAGEFQAGDSRSGEVEIRPKAQGPVTTVLVRQLTPDDSWWVLGCVTANLRILQPAPGSTVASPVRVSGQSTAFEATISLEVRQDGSLDPIGTDITMGGANGEMGPYSTAITFSPPSADAGAIVVKTLSAEDGNVQEASVSRIRF